VIDSSHIPGVHAGSFLIPGGNGLPDLEVLTTDPASWVTMQIAARTAPAPTPPQSGADPQGNILPGGTSPGTSLPEWLSGTGLKDTLQGLLVAGGMIILAIVLIGLGGWKLIED
jgi:hypothetical protein